MLLLVALLLTACGSSVDPAPRSSAPTPTSAAAAYLTPTPGIVPVQFPEDEAPHEMLTEWWYYTGHLFTEDGTRYGFEYVIFKALRGAFPPYYASHFAITNSAGDEFVYAEKFGIDATRQTDAGFAFDLDGWTMRGALGEDHLAVDMDGYAIDLDLSSTKPPALHDEVGYVDFGASGGSYYYSRTRIDVTGIHQFQRPRRRMVAGTNKARTTVASRATAIATPRPSALISTMSAKANDPATTTTMRAALVTIRPLRSSPRETASVLSPVRSHTSFIRESRKTS